MTFTRRDFLAAALAAAAYDVAAQSAWPTAKPIRIVVPFAAGGASDVAARVLAQHVGDALKTPVVVENKPGAHGTVGIGEVMRAPADGYTLLMGSTGTMAVNPRLHEKLPYDANKDFAPVSLVTISPNVVVVNPTVLPVKDMQALVEYLRANPGKVSYGTAGAGNSGHITTEYFKARTKTSMLHVPYKGDAAAMNDLIAGHVQIMFTTVLAAMPQVKSGRVRMLATAGRERLADFPDVPTVEEALKLKDFEAVSWQAVYVRAGTPSDIVNRLSAEFDAALRNPSVVRRLAELGALPGGGPPSRLEQFQRREQEKWGAVIRDANIKPE